MSYNIDFTIAASNQIEAALCRRIESIRLSRNITQEQLADESGVSTKTIGRMERGEGVSLDTFIRVMIALKIQHNLEGLLPDPSVRPIERVGLVSGERKRARPNKHIKDFQTWSWGVKEDEK
jgi:transcriptional regulator with XRE-family HTH domain